MLIFDINQTHRSVYLYDDDGRIILTNSTHGTSHTEVSTNYDVAGNIIEVNTTYNGQLTTSIDYEYNSENLLIYETINEFLWLESILKNNKFYL